MMPLWRASDFYAGYEFSFCSWVWSGIANDAENRGKQNKTKKPNPKPFSSSMGHSPAQMICNFFWKGREMLVIFKHCLPSSNTFYDYVCCSFKYFMDIWHLGRMFLIVTFGRILAFEIASWSLFFKAVSKSLGIALKLLLCSVNSNPILWRQDKFLTDINS